MAANLAVPNRRVLEEQVRRLLERARGRHGVSVEDMVQALGDLQPRRAETRRSWYDWQEKPETVSALTAVASLHLLGRDAAMELLFGDPAQVPSSRAEVAQLRGQVDDLRILVDKAQTRLAAVESHLGNLTVAESGAAVPLTGPLAAVLRDVEAEVDALWSITGPAADQPSPTAAELERLPLEERLGLAEARLMEAASRLDLAHQLRQGSEETENMASLDGISEEVRRRLGLLRSQARDMSRQVHDADASRRRSTGAGGV